LRARALEKSLSLSLEYATDIPRHYGANAGRLSQTLLNLVTNAIKYTQQGSVKLRVLAAEPGPYCGRLRFEVEDTGDGISAEDQPHVFDPFWRASTNGNKTHQGTGLGLDIVRRNIEHLGGSVGLESQPGEGTMFWFEVPMETVEDEVSADEAGRVTEKRPAQKRYQGRVLLADDNLTNLELGRMLLEQRGLEVATADDGNEAVAKAKVQAFDLVLMDLQMPYLNGREAAEQIHQLPGMAELPIVALTASIDEEEKRKCRESGMCGYLVKPVSPSLLDDELEKLLVHATQDDPTMENMGNKSLHQLRGENRESAMQLLDREVLGELKAQLGTQNFAIVIEKFREESAERRESMQVESEAGDEVAVAREAHTLASSFRSFGLLVAGDALIKLEQDLKSGKRKDFQFACDDIQVLLSKSLEAFNGALETA
jgi:CheY-like chemotaxis protein